MKRESNSPPVFATGGTKLQVIVCYPFLDLRFLVDGFPEPGWLDGDYSNVGSLGGVTRGAGDGQKAELRLDAALLFSGEYLVGPSTGRPKRRRRPIAVDGLIVTNRRLLADMDGQVRVEVVLEAAGLETAPLEETLERVLTTPVYIVRLTHTELISAGFRLARTYLEQSAKTAGPPSGELTTRLLREGAGSPFLVVLRPGVPAAPADGLPLIGKPDILEAATCKLMELAGRPTGVWQIWLGNKPIANWEAPVRMLCRIICQLSEVTSLLRLQRDPQALAPYLLNTEKTDNFFNVRSGQLRRKKQGDWSVAAVLGFANEHLKVSIEDTAHSREELNKLMAPDIAGTLAVTIARIEQADVNLPTEAKPMDQKDKLRLVDLLAEQAINENGYFRRLIQQADLNKQFKQQRQDGWSGQGKSDALDLVDWALAKGANPADARYSTLASILLPELDGLGFKEAAAIVALVSKYKLLIDGSLLDDLRRRFQVPVYVRDEPAAALGPDFDWHGPQDALELQSWLRPEPPDFLELSYLMDAISQARSVCLVAVAATNTTGTGVLIGRRFVLTNCHVLVPLGSNIAPTTHANSVKLQFGVFNNKDATAEFSLDLSDPVPVSSATEKLDYVLLRVRPEIDSTPMLQLAKPARDVPALKTSLSILQHPWGDSMKLAPSNDAVTFADPARGVLQYVTRTAAGSSGAPCFDPLWRLVALHHAERSRTFGTIREGILIDPILKELEARLNPAELGWN